MGVTILVVDDDPVLSELVSYILHAEGYDPVVASNGEEGLRLFHATNPALVLLDVTMPEMDGFEVCRRIRAISSTPIIMLTAQGSEDAIVKGLDLGADDYVTKPFQLKPLMARVRANLRRANAPQPHYGKVTYQDEYLTIDLESHRVLVKGEPVKLTPTEYKLLALLVKNRGRVLEFRQLLEQVWGFEYIDEVDYLRVYIWHLRRKIEPDPKNPRYLHNELSIGYRFDPL
ncbi:MULTISPECIES: response regulator transcription factor [Caldilinea]|jgi:two-component system KDP operon response regulator KdpE|uniref:Putative OmpR family two-component response regulator n=2 Tax=Caldilinea TaxID=233191 RepID=I0I2G0_CALAS|nr:MULTISPECIES: response regulator transcription factor [Caldilinea]BAL99447.1 putative OmpR family two-component response regulator [Caldilinea aerophila DSM 14535 = NBRC 104270]GIV73959.1 MAG: DNA-binding response regulator [Caldilinea sp.]